jgi:ABC-2 type transport system ATP-binding protein
MKAVVQVDKLRKVYGSTVAVDEISFEVYEGEIFGVVGPNGAGKTTTIECLEGLRKPDSGTVRVLGVDPQVDGQILRERAGMQLQQSNLPERMRVWEALDLYASFYPRAVDWQALLARLGMAEKRNTPFAKLSGGQKQRLFIAMALLPDPRLIFLDELTTGLDPQARHAIWDLVRDVRAQGKTILLTTHFMEEAERLCDRVAILDQGRIIALDTPQALIHELGAEERVVFVAEQVLPADFVECFQGEVKLEKKGEQVILHAINGRNVPLVSEVVSLLAEKGVRFHDLRTEQPNLEDVFLNLTGRGMRE